MSLGPFELQFVRLPRSEFWAAAHDSQRLAILSPIVDLELQVEGLALLAADLCHPLGTLDISKVVLVADRLWPLVDGVAEVGVAQVVLGVVIHGELVVPNAGQLPFHCHLLLFFDKLLRYVDLRLSSWYLALEHFDWLERLLTMV